MAPKDLYIPDGVHRSIDTANWMSSIDGNPSLTQLTIPGTHDACARVGGLGNFASCQNLSLAEQFNAGIRFVDIRCRLINNAFAIYHGMVYQQLDFCDVVTLCHHFLKAHPTECILMSVKHEGETENSIDSFEQVFKRYAKEDPDLWHFGSSVPYLDEVRGKIVLLRRFEVDSPELGPELGIDVSDWNDNATFTCTNNDGVIYSVQDNYHVDWEGDDKLDRVKKHLNDAEKDHQDALYINFTNGSNIPWDTPRRFAVESINPRLSEYFKTLVPVNRYGIFALDFCEQPGTLVKQIVAFNALL